MAIRLIAILVFIISLTRASGQDSLMKVEEDLSDRDLLYEHPICKLPELVYIEVKATPHPVRNTGTSPAKKPLLSATGEISYQHFARTGNSDDLLLMNSSSDIAILRLGLLYREVYPFSFSVRYNRSRPFQLDNQYEVNIGFDERLFRQKIKDKIVSSVQNDFIKRQLQLTDQYQAAFKSYQQQAQQLKDPAYIQQAVESRLRNTIPNGSRLPSTDIPASIGKLELPGQLTENVPFVSKLKEIKQKVEDSINNVREKLNLDEAQKRLHAKLEEKKDSLEKKVKKLEDSLASLKKEQAARLDSVRKELNEIKSSAKLKEYAGQKGLKDSSSHNKWTDVLMKTNLRFGKFILNSSGLTVNNIFLSGASIKYGDEKFIVLSGGIYDFAFRQVFNFRNDSFPRHKQTVFAVKVGKTDGDNLSAFNFYIGRKSKTSSISSPLRTVAGISVEKRISFNPHVSLDLEVAKSTTRPANQLSKQEEALKDIFTRFSTGTLAAYASLDAELPKTRTRIEASYRYWGQQFESFNASRYFNPQNNIAGKVSQPFFKRKLYLVTGIRYTDFSSFGIASNMKTKVLFASANLTLRIKKVPIVSVGFYPGSQLYWLDQNRLYEYIYYIFNATVSHYFKVSSVPVQALFTWNRFYNKYTDTLVKGSQSYYNFFLTAWGQRFSYNTSVSRQEIENNVLNTLEGGINYSAGIFKIGGSIKGNFNGHTSRMGYSFIGGVMLNKIGTINLIYDRSFLPARNGRFIPITMSQVQIVKPIKFAL